MKKIFMGMTLLFAAASLTASAQDDTKTKSKPTSTVPQKVHNAVSKHKKHKGHKVKHKSSTTKVTTTTKHD